MIRCLCNIGKCIHLLAWIHYFSHVYTCLLSCMHARMCVCTCISTCVCTCISMCVCCMCMCVCMCACVYACTHEHTCDKCLTISVLQACCAVTTEYGIPSNLIRKSTASLQIKISTAQLNFSNRNVMIF